MQGFNLQSETLKMQILTETSLVVAEILCRRVVGCQYTNEGTGYILDQDISEALH
jgi:hypothetical protein